MGDRRKGRELALQVMYGIDQSRLSADEVLRHFWLGREDVSDDVRAFTETLVRGTIDKLEEIDRTITANSSNWKIPRMAVVDRNVLRLAIYELNWCPEIPLRVTLNEAIEIVKLYGTEESGAFVNGVLDKIAKGMNKE